MSTMTHIRDVRKKAPMVTGLFGPLKDTVLLLKSRGIPMDLPPVNKQVRQRTTNTGQESTVALLGAFFCSNQPDPESTALDAIDHHRLHVNVLCLLQLSDNCVKIRGSILSHEGDRMLGGHRL